jgi:ligand-binding sensor domain-containing protein
MRRATILILILISFFKINLASDWQTFTNMNHVWEILLKDGKLWCATTGGALAFNLQDESVTKFTNAEGLGGNQLMCVAKDSFGSLWFGARNGTLTKYQLEKDSWRVYIIEKDKKRLRVRDIIPDFDKLWIASSGVVSLFLIEKNQGEIKETYQRFGDILPDSVNCIALGGGRIWVGTDQGMAFAEKDDPRINLQDPTSWSSFSEIDSENLTNDFVRSLWYFQDGLYLGTDDGLFRFIEQDSSFEDMGLGGLKINDLKVLNENVTAATNNGVYIYSENRWSVVPWEGMSTRWANSVDVDPSGSLWIGTPGKGLSTYDSEQWSNYLIEGPTGNTFSGLTIDSQGRIWCANFWDGASSFDGQNWVSYREIMDSVSSGSVGLIVSVAVDSEDNIWFGSWGGGLFGRSSSNDWVRYKNDNSPLRGVGGYPNYVVVNGISIDEQGNRWFANREAFDGTRLVVLDAADQWSVFTSEDGLLDSIINQIFVNDSHLWGCFQGAGLCDYDYNGTIPLKGDDDLRCYGTSDDLIGEVKCVNIDERGTLWAGTNEGLFRFNTFDQVFEKVPLPSGIGPQVSFITVDQLNNKWIATIHGLAILNDLGVFTDSLNTDNSELCHDLIWSLAIDGEKGEVWIGTENGLSRFKYPGVSPIKRLSDVIAYPNPAVIRTGDEQVSFSLLPSASRIKIFTVAGEHIKEITFEQSWKWDLKNSSGKLVSSGIYLFLVYDDEGNSWVGKIAVIRE